MMPDHFHGIMILHAERNGVIVGANHRSPSAPHSSDFYQQNSWSSGSRPGKRRTGLGRLSYGT
jgi:hypothetical protein